MHTATARAVAADKSLQPEIARRRTFAIISHPDAGKTTLTEKLLLCGGAIQLAGQVRAKGERRRTRSDWMNIERERGISVVTSVMTFEYGGHVLNLLDTPGHEDFSEDTYRTLTAVDAAIMVIDAAKGIEARTRKLFEICRLRDIPIVTFVNKMDREAKDPLELLDEIAQTLQLETAPATWPIGRGRDFKGTVERGPKEKGGGKIRLLEEADRASDVAELTLSALLGAQAHLVEEELELIDAGYPPVSQQAFREGNLTPVYFGSALKNFGVVDLLEGLIALAPPPRDQQAESRVVHADEPKLTGFVFKIQANMDPQHRDRIAFVRLCSGKLTRGMRVKLPRSGKTLGLNAPQFFFGQDRGLAEQAFAGDVVGVPNNGLLRIGDTVTEGEELRFLGVPSFAPEILRRVVILDAMKAKKLRQALTELAEEGVMQIFRPLDGSLPIIGVVGQLQLDVLADRLEREYGVEVKLEASPYTLARWIKAADRATRDAFVERHRAEMAEDLDGDPVLLASSIYSLEYIGRQTTGVTFLEIKDGLTGGA